MRMVDAGRCRRAWQALATWCLVPVVAGCSLISPDRPQAQPLAKTTLRVAVTKDIDTVGVRMGVAEGVFDDGGLTVELLEQPDHRSSLAALADGKADVAVARNITLLRAADSGSSLQIQGEAYIAGPNTMGLVTLPDTGYQQPSEVPEPQIAVAPDDDLGRLCTRSRLTTEGVDPDDIDFHSRSYDDMIAGMRAGTIDAAWLAEPDIIRAQREHGATLVTDTSRGELQDFPISAFAADGDTVEEHPETFARFRELLAEVQQLANDPADVREALSSIVGLDATTASLVALGNYPLSVNDIRLQRVADLMHRSGLIDERLDVAALVPPDARP